MSRVVVVTNRELGWNCVVGVYSDLPTALYVMNVEMETENTERDFQAIGYCFFERTVEDGEGY